MYVHEWAISHCHAWLAQGIPCELKQKRAVSPPPLEATKLDISWTRASWLSPATAWPGNNWALRRCLWWKWPNTITSANTAPARAPSSSTSSSSSPTWRNMCHMAVSQHWTFRLNLCQKLMINWFSRATGHQTPWTARAESKPDRLKHRSHWAMRW